MVRPRKCRRVGAVPGVTYFKPRGVPLSELNEVDLSVDGYEALRLADHQGLKHEDAAAKMQVSRQTFSRMVARARQIVADVLVSGCALRIRGGDYALGSGMDSRTASTDAPICCDEEKKMEKIAITSEGPGLDDALDPRFGRAAGFIIFDPAARTFEYVDNGASQSMAQGAGIQAAENVANSGASAVLTGYVGPKAFKVLSAAGIKVGQDLGDMTVRQAIDQFVKGKVDWARQPNRQGHGR